MKFIFRYLKTRVKPMSLGLMLKTVGTILELLIPMILTHTLELIKTVSGNSEGIRMIVVWGIAMILCALATVICNVTGNRVASRVAKDAAEEIRHDLFSRIMTLSGRQTDKFTIPSLESRVTTDTYNVHHFIGMIQRMGIRAPIMIFGGLAITLFKDPLLSLIMFSMLPFILFIVIFITKKGIPLYTNVQKSVDSMVRVVREDTQGIRVIKALSKTEHEKSRYDKVNKNLVKNEIKASLTMGVVNPAMNLLMNLGLSCVVLIGAYLVSGAIRGYYSTPETIIAFTQYFTMISMSLMAITRIFVMTTKSTASAKRIQEVVDTEPDLVLRSESEFPKKDDGDAHIVFDDVCFSYNGTKDNLTNISFSVPHGGTLGIIGSTGSGKTTIVNLLMRFYDVGSGSVRIDGYDVRTIPEEKLHTMFGVALQNDFLYADTIEENIKFGRELTREQVVTGAKIAQAHDFISSFDDGYEHMLSQKGTNVSGGQKQRILISRAVAGEPEILILDDSSSALDYRTDANLRRAINEQMKNTTTVVVAQRVSSVMSSDVIVVLEEGEIIGIGDHDHLMKTCEVYREISNSQMGGAFLE